MYQHCGSSNTNRQFRMGHAKARPLLLNQDHLDYLCSPHIECLMMSAGACPTSGPKLFPAKHIQQLESSLYCKGRHFLTLKCNH